MVKTANAVLLVLLLAACRTPVGELRGIPAPAADAWPAEPLAVLIEHNPWAMVIGADTPRAEIFTDGTFIRLDAGDPARAPRLFVSQLTPAELARVGKAIRPSAAFWRLKDQYNVAPNVTDQVTTELVVREGERAKQVYVYGYAPEEWKPPAYTVLPGGEWNADALPEEFDRICRLLVALKPTHEVPWLPRYVEVMIWPYEYSPDAPLVWPERWPGLTSPMAFPRGESWSLILPGSEFAALEAFVAGRGERQAILIDGKKWAIDYRPVMPGGSWAKDIAARVTPPDPSAATAPGPAPRDRAPAPPSGTRRRRSFRRRAGR